MKQPTENIQNKSAKFQKDERKQKAVENFQLIMQNKTPMKQSDVHG